MLKNYFTKLVNIAAMLLLLPAFEAVTAFDVCAQGGGISGVVKDAQGPVIGASVVINDGTTGTTTDLDGAFSLP